MSDKRLFAAILLFVTLCHGEFSRPSFAHPSSSSNDERDTCPLCYNTPDTGFPAYGVPSGSDAFPNYHERSILAWYNLVRMDPLHFKSSWLANFMKDNSISNVFNTSLYSATHAIPWNLNLNRAARAHCAGTNSHFLLTFFDRSTCDSSAGGSPHNDCNSTTTSNRVAKFYSGWNGEIYWEYALLGTITNYTWPFFAVAGWICDGSLWSNGVFSGCPVDGAGTSGHRNIIMSVGKEVGCGTYFTSSTAYSTCDEGSGLVYKDVKILSGTHIFDPTTSTKMFFLANFYSNETVSSASVVIDGSATAMTLESGTNMAGSWVSPSSTAGTGCRKYHFEFTTASGKTVYPAAGYFTTYGEGNCVTDYSDGSDSSTDGGSTGDSSSAEKMIVNLIAIVMIVFVLF